MLRDINFYQSEVILRFDEPPSVNTLVNSAFNVVSNDGHEPGFKPIDVSSHYNSVSLRLQLIFDDPVKVFDGSEDAEDYVYTFTVAESVTNPFGKSMGGYSTTFILAKDTTDSELGGIADHIVSATDDPDPIPYEPEPIEIVDHSIRTDVADRGFFVGTPGEDGDDLRIVRTVPSDGDLFVPSYFNGGRINIWFSDRPDPDSVHEGNFRLQKRKVGTGLRWRDLRPESVTLHKEHPMVSIQLPDSGNDTYFEADHRYRVVVSGMVQSE